jgi:methylthioribose-1-phosphate isomerase
MTDQPLTLPFQPIAWEGGTDGRLRLLDQRALPHRETSLVLTTAQEVFDAIRTLAVRGAPAIGAAAGYGLVLGARQGADPPEVRRKLRETKEFLAGARPTARNLFWALDRVAAAADRAGADRNEILEAILREARAIEAEDRLACERIGRALLELLPEPIRAMTHCNAGALATCGIGTALAPFYVAQATGRDVTVFSCETRPLLQGARLTTWELSRAGIPVSLLADSARAHLLKLGRVNAVVVGADRIARNGDAANKIGTYDLAVLARRHGVPFFVAAPLSTFDPQAPDGDAIEIEERPADEVACIPGHGRIAPPGIDCLNPAFDVTPAELITAIVTERGVAKPPNPETVGELLAG